MLNRLNLLALCLTILFTNCSTPEQVNETSTARQVIAEWPHAVTYEIFVQSFADSDGDSIGDINGMRQKLPYLQDLGIKALWLMPVSPSPSYHKYDITDYRAIHPDYGSIEDFKAFVQEAHDRDIKVIIDLVVNHTDWHHPWFEESVKGPDNPYRDFYVWENSDSVRQQLLASGRIDGTEGYLPEWHTYPGNEELYYGFFWKGMPDLNYDHPQVREEIKEIGRYWLQEIDVDGFRLDAALYIYPKDRVEDTRQWWEEFRAEMEQVKEDVYLVGEVWAETDITAPFFKGLNSTFNFDLAFAITKTLQTETDSGLVQLHQRIREAYREVNPDFTDATFLTNHDQNRIMSELDNNPNKAKLAAALLMTLPGTPYIYYGEELGMRGKKPDEEIREPFLWITGQDTLRTAWITPKYNTDADIGALNVQQNDTSSIFSHYKELIHLRNTSRALTYGNLKAVEDGSDKVISFTRTEGSESLLVLHNLSGETQKISFNTDFQDYTEILWGENIDPAQISLSPYSSIVLKSIQK